jgi:broad specificity phosphatase PhoE
MAPNLGVSSPSKPMNSSRLTLISHGATEAQRRASFPLDESVLQHEIGKITELKWKMPAAGQVWSAPEQRTQQTSRALGLEFTLAEELRDCDCGRWRGRTMDEVQMEDHAGIFAWLSDPGAAPHGGESLENLIDRVRSWMNQQETAKHVIAVTHPAIIRSAIVHALQLPALTFWRIDIAPLTMTDLRFNNHVWTLRCSGCPLQNATQAEGERSDI